MFRPPVRAKGLLKRGVVIGQTAVDDASLFPFFDRAGHVKMLMLVSEHSDEIVFIDCESGTASAWPWRRICLNVEGAEAFEPARPDTIERACRLWHFDPWWVLGEPRYAGHWAVPHLKQTNFVGKTEREVFSVMYRGDLSRISWVVLADHGGQAKHWRADLLPSDHPPALPTVATKGHARHARGWRLAPVWQGKLKR